MMKCPQVQGEEALRWADEISNQVRQRPGYEQYATCYTYHAGQSICNNWEPVAVLPNFNFPFFRGTVGLGKFPGAFTRRSGGGRGLYPVYLTLLKQESLGDSSSSE
jgi:hypothetical protein